MFLALFFFDKTPKHLIHPLFLRKSKSGLPVTLNSFQGLSASEEEIPDQVRNDNKGHMATISSLRYIPNENMPFE
jgi:hypothetical protein